MQCCRAFFIILAAAYLTSSSFGQEDLSRNRDLPSRIGGPSCTNSGRGTATLHGSLTVQGSVPAGREPKFSVAVYAAGTLVTRQRVKNGGSFSFYCLPTNSVTLSAEADSVEIGSVNVGSLSAPPMSNRQDMIVNWTESGGPKLGGSASVISARDTYKRSPENQKLMDQAAAAHRSRKADDASKILKQLVDADPADYVAWYEMGVIEFGRSKFEAAYSAFERSVAANSTFVPSLIGQGRSALSLKNFDRAVELLTAAIIAEPDSADAHHYIGESYLQSRRGSLAIKHMNRAIEIAPAQKYDLHLRIGALYNAAGAKNLAANEFKLLLQKAPNHPEKAKLELYIRENGESGK